MAYIKLPDGEAEGARDLQVWSGRRLAGRGGVPVTKHVAGTDLNLLDTALRRYAPGSPTWCFISSVKTSCERYGSMTPKQRQAIKAAIKKWRK
jgi:hypothetical protein